MPCPDIDDLELFASHESDPGSSAALDLHLRSCAACRARFDDVRENLRILDPVRRAFGVPGTGLAGLERDSGPVSIPGFELRGELGRGGMGVVYEAEQAHPRRVVALKLLNPAYGADRRHERLFEREVQALARLRHPHLAAVYGAGRAPDGRPYFAMERVRGRALRAWLQEERPPLRVRLALFAEICAAVAYAHGRGVIHRDLKPSNILVDDEGRPRVLDFGLARVLEDEHGADLTHSGDGQVQGTIPYMSPEQVRGEVHEIDARSDVYSLGVVLYELLVGRLPYVLSPTNMIEAARTICEQPPAPPGAADPALRGDLEAILLKVLEKEPGRRYPSAAALAEDVRRYLAGEPVTARAPTLTYVLGRLIRRHRLVFGLAAALVLAVAGFGTWMALLYAHSEHLRGSAELARTAERAARGQAESEARRAAQEAENAKVQAARAEAVSEFLTDMLEDASPIGQHAASDPTLRDVLERTARGLDEGSLAGQPEVETTVRVMIGEAYLALARYADAERQFSRALAVQRGLAAPEPQALARALNAAAMGVFANGRAKESEPLFEEAWALRRAALGPDHPDTLECLSHLALCRNARGAVDEAEQMLREALAGYEAAPSERHDVDEARIHSQLASVLERQERFDEAERHQRAGIELYRRTLPDHPMLAQELHDLGRLLQRSRGVSDETRSLSEEALAILRRRLGDQHPDVGRALVGYGTMLQDDADYEGAAARYLEGLAIFRAHGSGQGISTATVLNNLAWVRRHQGRYDESETYAQEALDLRRELFGPGPDVANSLNFLGVLRTDQGRLVEAEALHREALELRRRVRGGRTMDVAGSLTNLATTLHAAGEYEEALRVRSEALELATAILGPEHHNLATMMQGQADSLRSIGDLAAAEDWARRALDMRRRLLGDDNPATGFSLHSLALIRMDRDDLAGAEAAAVEALEIQRAKFGETHVNVAGTQRVLSDIRRQLGDLAGAEALLRSAVATYEQVLAERDPRTANARVALGRCLLARERFDEAESELIAAAEVLAEQVGWDHAQTQDAVELLVQVYDAIDPDAAADWRTRLDRAP